MTFIPQNPEQERVVMTQAELTVVLGGAGVGKTTCALAAAHTHLERAQETMQPGRSLLQATRATRFSAFACATARDTTSTQTPESIGWITRHVAIQLPGYSRERAASSVKPCRCSSSTTHLPSSSGRRER